MTCICGAPRTGDHDCPVTADYATAFVPLAPPSAGVESATKVCTRCKEEKPLSEYGKHSKSKDGLEWRCTPCKRATRMESQRRCLADPERREKQREYAASWAREDRRKDPEKYREEQAQNYHAKHNLTLETARNNRKPWTGPELERVADWSISTTELARILGRTQGAVREARRRMLANSQLDRLTGAPICGASAKVGALRTINGRSLPVVATCTLLAGHTGDHRDGVRKTRWPS